MSDPALSVVVPARDRAHTLVRVLEALASQADALPFEVVIADDRSSDGTAALTDRYRDRLDLRRVDVPPPGGAAAARNRGADAARGPILLFLDSDIEVPPGFLRRHLEAHAAREPDGPVAYFGPVRIPEQILRGAEHLRDVERSYRDFWAALDDPHHVPRGVDLGMAAVSLPRVAFVEAGGFDESFGSQSEDVELGHRLLAAGVRFVFEPALVSLHLDDKSVESLRSDARRRGRADVRLVQTHPPAKAAVELAEPLTAHPLRRLLQRTAARVPAAVDAGGRALERCAPAWPARAPLLRRRGRLLRERAAYWTGVRDTGPAGARVRELLGSRLTVLTYHRVSPDPDPLLPELCVSPEVFRAQLDTALAHGWTPVPLAAWVRWWERNEPLPARAFAITFDDGFADLLAHAVPELERRRLPATVFVLPGDAGGTNDWDRPMGAAPRRLLAAEEMRALAAVDGLELGSHGWRHVDLRRLPDPELADSLARSRDRLSELVERDVRTLAYPFGAWDARVHRAAADAGYGAAVTIEPGVNDVGVSRWALRRMAVENGDRDDAFLARLRGRPA